MFVLPKIPSVGEKLAQSISSGLGKGVDIASQLALEKAKKGNIVEDIQKLRSARQDQSAANSLSGDKLQSQGQNFYNQIAGNETAPKEQSFNDLTDLPTDVRLALSQKYPEAMKFIQGEEKQKSKERFSREQSAEPELRKMEDQARGLEQTEMDYSLLNELFSPENESKFPPGAMVALFSKDGELNPIAESQLSPEANRAVKILVNQLKGAKDTFGARLTNFDVSTYLKGLPSLLQSPEGRRGVLRDLSIINQLNSEYYTGLLDTVDQYGGPGNISLSKAERMFKKKFAPRMKQLREEYVHGEDATFNNLPPANRYRGRMMEDPETGQKFQSDGKEWNLVE